MARPMKNGMDYFPHNTNAGTDPKIDAMRTQFGNDGYAFYFMLLEMIYRDGKPLDVSNAAILNSVCKRLMVTEELFKKMMLVAIDIGLFSQKYLTKQVIFSNGTEKRMNQVTSDRNNDRTRKMKCSDTSALSGFPAENNRKTTGIREFSSTDKTRQDKTRQERRKYSLSPVEKNIIAEFTTDKKLAASITGFLEMRTGKGKETTEHALREILVKANQLAESKRELAAIFDQSTVNCWADLFALKEPLPEDPAERVEKPEPHHLPLYKLQGWESLKPDEAPVAWTSEDELARKFTNGPGT